MSESIGLETLGGRVQVKWDDESAATPFGQMAFFAEFLAITGVYKEWIEDCPLQYKSPNGSSNYDILGTWFLSILSGHWRYAHITAIRSDRVIPSLLGMKQAVSEDTVRRALLAIEEHSGFSWLQKHLDQSVATFLSKPWILDVDVTVKPLYGKQEGAVVGYNPQKPGRPSHTYHSYIVAGLRLVLGVDVEAGNQSHSNTTLPGLLKVIDKLPREKRPAFVRGDIGFGNNHVMEGLEERELPYLFKLKMTNNVKRYINEIAWKDGWTDAGQGWEGIEGNLKLMGWHKSRRVIVLRRQIRGEIVLRNDEVDSGQLMFVEFDQGNHRFEYVTLITEIEYPILSIAQLYRDRADAENCFDELKNQWGWCGYTTNDLKRSRFSAMTIALIYNWWSIFSRLANPKMRMEAITSRPFLLSGIGRMTRHAGQQCLTITNIHGKGELAQEMLEKVSQRLHKWKSAAEQLAIPSGVWNQASRLIAFIFSRNYGPRLLIPP